MNQTHIAAAIAVQFGRGSSGSVPSVALMIDGYPLLVDGFFILIS